MAVWAIETRLPLALLAHRPLTSVRKCYNIGMKRYSPGIFETLAESLSVYLLVLRRCWLPLLAVFAAMELAMAFVRVPSVTVVDLTAWEKAFSSFLSLTLGVLAVTIAIDGTSRLCCGRRDSESGGIAVAWGRAVGTALLYGLAFAGMLLVIGLASFSLAHRIGSPSAGISGASFGAVVFIGGCGIIALAVLAVWALVRWMFSVTMSVLYPFAGPSAMRASARFVSGRLLQCFLFGICAYLVAAGMGFLPNVVGFYGATGVPGAVEPMLGGEVARAALRFATGLLSDFAGLYICIAGLVFIMRAEDRGDIPEAKDPRLQRAALALLIVLGAAAFAFSGFVVSKALPAQAASFPKLELRGGKGPRVFELPKDFAFAESLREKDGTFEIVSPFELRIGSTEYARQLGDVVSTLDADPQSDDATSFATVRLARPYYGIETARLTFKGAERRLAQVALMRGPIFGAGEGLTLPDCRDLVAAIAADMGKRFGVSVGEMTGRERSDAAAEYSVELERKAKANGGSTTVAVDLARREFSVRTGEGVVSYSVNGQVGVEDGAGCLVVSVCAEP